MTLQAKHAISDGNLLEPRNASIRFRRFGDDVAALAGARTGFYGAVIAAMGVLASGPLSIWIVSRSHPQPPWSSPSMFVRYYHPIQSVPFVFGFMLVAGFVALLASIHALATPSRRALSTCAFAFATIYAALVFFNYVVQISFIPVLVRHYDAENGALIAAFSMVNPQSLAWSLEMWGYAFLGLATWLSAGCFSGGGLERATRWAFIANGPISVAGACWTALQPGWELTDLGFVSFALWNVLGFAIATMAALVFRTRLRGYVRSRRRAIKRGHEALNVEFAP